MMANTKPTLTEDLPKISMLVISVLIMYWSLGSKTTFYYTVIIALSIIIFRQKEIKSLFINDIVSIFKEDEE